MRITWKLAPDGKGGWIGLIDLGVDPRAVSGGGKLVAMARGADKPTALGKAAVIAKNALENPLIAAIMPPQAAIAVKAISALSKAASVGKLDDAVKKFTGPAVKRLGRVLGGLF